MDKGGKKQSQPDWLTHPRTTGGRVSTGRKSATAAHLGIGFILFLSFPLLVLTLGNDVIGLGAKHLTYKDGRQYRCAGK